MVTSRGSRRWAGTCAAWVLSVGQWVTTHAVMYGCSTEKERPGTPSGAASESTATSSSAGSEVPAVSDVSASGPPSPGASSESPSTSVLPLGVVEPGTPTVLASEVVFGARLCLGAENRIYFPNRIGYPQNSGLEQLWTVSRTGGDARVVATPGSVVGCVEVGDQVWTASNNSAAIVRVDVASGNLLEAYPTAGTALQVARNSTRVFASLEMQTPSSEIVSIDPQALGEPQKLWSKPGQVTALWLHADDERLLFSAREGDTAAWVVRVAFSPAQVTELVTTAGELGAVDGKGNFVYYAHYSRNEVHKVDVTTHADSVLTTLEQPWALLVDGDYLYVGTRPDYCSNNEGKVFRIPLAGGEPTLLADNLNCPSQMVSDQAGLYWINTGSWQGPSSGQAAPADGSVMHLARR